MDLYENDLDCCVKFWTSLKVMASKCGPSFLAKYGNDILSIINEIFTDRNFRDIHSQTKKQKFILRKEFIVPITTLVFRLFHDFGGNGWLSSSEDMSATLLQLAPKGIELMNNLIKTTKAAQAQASSAIANIIISCNNNPQFDELAAHILKIVFPHLINSNLVKHANILMIRSVLFFTQATTKLSRCLITMTTSKHYLRVLKK